MTPITNVFKALSDPVRMEMVLRLSEGNKYTLGGISSGLNVTRQGARKHLAILEDAALIQLQKRGRETEVHLNPESLKLVKDFIAKLERQWDQRLLALKEFVEKDQT